MHQAFFNLSNLLGREHTNATQEILRRQRLNPLHKECALPKKARWYRNLELLAANGCRVRDHAYQGAILVLVWNAYD